MSLSPLPIKPQHLVHALALLTLVVAGCRQEQQYGADQSRFAASGFDPVTRTAFAERDDFIRLDENDERVYVLDGRTGEPLVGRDLLARMRTADVVILGETHTDPLAHRLQVRFIREALADGGALSLEMMARDEQVHLDRIRSRPGAAEAELAETELARWPRWRSFYLPQVEAALQMGRPVVAANAPRALVTAARERGYDYLRNLPDDQQRLFDLPDAGASYPEYRRRVGQAALSHGPSTRPSTRPQRERMDAHLVQGGSQTTPTTRPRLPGPTRTPRDPMSADAFYDAQLVWDATMARSIITAVRRHGRPVVHMVGSFHSDHGGGLTQMLRERGLDVLTVTFVPVDSERLQPGDEGRADVVIYTGANRPLPPERVAESATRTPATRPAGRVAPATRQPELGQTPPVAGRGAAAPATVPTTRRATTRGAGR